MEHLHSTSVDATPADMTQWPWTEIEDQTVIWEDDSYGSLPGVHEEIRVRSYKLGAHKRVRSYRIITNKPRYCDGCDLLKRTTEKYGLQLCVDCLAQHRVARLLDRTRQHLGDIVAEMWSDCAEIARMSSEFDTEDEWWSHLYQAEDALKPLEDRLDSVTRLWAALDIEQQRIASLAQPS